MTMRKQTFRCRALSLFWAVLMALSLLPGAVLAANGNRATSPPSRQTMVSKTADDLLALAGKEVSGTFEPGGNIDMPGKDMAPIKKLSSLFDGNGYVISNVTITGAIKDGDDAWDPSYAGLLALLDGMIQNLTLQNVNISLAGSVISGSALGA